MRRKPEKLKEGDQVILLSPAGVADLKLFEKAIETLTNWGLKPIISENSLQKYYRFSGSDKIRKDSFQDAIDNPEIKAIFCVRGGYGSTRIIADIDWGLFMQNPKWIIGYSDITTFHNQLNILNCESIHGSMPVNFETNTDESLQSLKECLFEKPRIYKFKNSVNNIIGQCEGQLVGGNLAILHNLLGTKFNIDYSNKILFIEEIGEFYYTIDRMLWAFKHAGIFDQISGLIVGDFSKMGNDQSNFPESLEEMILKFVKDKEIPVIFNFPAGHEPHNLALILSGIYKLKVEEENYTIEYISEVND